MNSTRFYFIFEIYEKWIWSQVNNTECNPKLLNLLGSVINSDFRRYYKTIRLYILKQVTSAVERRFQGYIIILIKK